MLNEESRRKIRELKLDELVDILDDQEHRLDVYASMSFDDRMSLTIDELYYQKNSKRSKRLISSAKLRYPDADINTLILEPRGLNKPRMIALAAESYLMDARNIIINGYTGAGKTYTALACMVELAETVLWHPVMWRLDEMLKRRQRLHPVMELACAIVAM